MIAYIVRRLLQGIAVLILVTILVFLIIRLLPGDPILVYVTSDMLQDTSQEQLNVLRHEFGIDKPMIVQYFDWIRNIFHGDLGRSIMYRSDVSIEIARRIPITFHLGILSLFVSLIIGIPAGIISAIRRGSWLDTLVTTIANGGITVPSFWLGIILIYIFGLHLGWLPIYGYTSPFENFWLSTRQLIMPVFCLAVFPMAAAARQTRSSLLEVIRQDYIRTAWSKGLREPSVIKKHALKNGLIPVITLLGMSVSNIFGGSVLLETVFNIPGMGRLAVQGILAQDYAIVQGCALIIAVTVLLVNLAIDISYGWIDPRIRYE